MKQLIVITSAMLVLSSPSFAVSVRGVALTPCHVFVSIDDSEQKGWFSAGQWMYGYLSGLNMAFVYLRQENPMSQIEFDAVYNYSLRYCKENPDKVIIDAIRSFTNQFIANN